MKIQQFNPIYEVWVLTPAGMVDITKEVVNIETQSSVRGTSNSWAITLVPNHPKGSMYDILEPMSYVEIRVKRVNKEVTTIMRGYINDVHKSFDIGSGTPQRTINVSGENYGKILRQAYIHYVAGPDTLMQLSLQASKVPMYSTWGVEFLSGNQKPSTVMQCLWDVLIYPQYQNINSIIIQRKGMAGSYNTERLFKMLDALSSGHVGDFKLDVDADGVNMFRNLGLDLGLTDPTLGAQEQSVLELLDKMYGKPWNELFTDDAPDATYLVYRPTPYRNRDGKFIGSVKADVYENAKFTDKTELGHTYQNVADTTLYPSPYKVVEPEDLIAYQLGRTDANVFNYYFTTLSNGMIGENMENFFRQQLDNKNPKFSFDYKSVRDKNGGKTPLKLTEEDMNNANIEFSRMDLYGFRKLQQVSNWMSVNHNELATDPEVMKKYYTTNANSFNRQGQALNGVLWEANEHNSQLESGQILMKGREDIRAGMYIKMKDERNDAESHLYYVVDCVHTIVPFSHFITRLSVIRGEGHLFHSKQDPDMQW